MKHILFFVDTQGDFSIIFMFTMNSAVTILDTAFSR